MARDYAKVGAVKSRKPARKRRHAGFIFIIILIVCVIGFFLYTERAQGVLITKESVSSFISNMISHFQHHKKIEQSSVKSSKKVTAIAQQDQSPSVRFDFYTALPSMQMPSPEESSNKPVVDNAPKKNIFDPEEIANMLDAEEQQTQENTHT